MSILRVKDENGNIIEIPVIKGDKGEKGDKGDAYALTDTDKEQIAALISTPIEELLGGI